MGIMLKVTSLYAVLIVKHTEMRWNKKDMCMKSKHIHSITMALPISKASIDGPVYVLTLADGCLLHLL